MYLVLIAWLYVVLMVAVVEAVSHSLLGATITFLLWGVLPLSIVTYLMRTPARRKARRAAEASGARALDPDGRGHPAGDPVAPEGIEAAGVVEGAPPTPGDRT